MKIYKNDNSELKIKDLFIGEGGMVVVEDTPFNVALLAILDKVKKYEDMYGNLSKSTIFTTQINLHFHPDEAVSDVIEKLVKCSTSL